MKMRDKLDKLEREMSEADLPLKESATQLVFASENPESGIVLIGEAPGRNEDLEGEPFVGRAGKLLDRLLRGIGLSRKEIYITNIVKYRPPNNRNPRISEIKAHSPYLVEQLKIIRPKVIVTLGNFSTKFILGEFDCDKMKKIEGISNLHGKKQVIHVDKASFIVIPVYHPAAALYNPNLKPVLEKDFEIIKRILESA